MAEMLSTLSVIAFSIGAVVLAFSVFLWFRFRIWKIMGDLSGRNARKSIEQIHKGNILLTDRKTKEREGKSAGGRWYGKTQQQEEKLRDRNGQEEDGNATEILMDEFASDRTEVLQERAKRFEILESLVIIHTEEAI